MGDLSHGLSAARVIAYGLPGLPLAALMLPLYIYLPAYYAEELGLGLATVGLVLLLARLSDVVTDPVIGALSDRTGARFGRRRVWIGAGVPIVLVGAHMLFTAEAGVAAGYLLFWTVAIYLGTTMILLPYGAWGAELSSDYDQRTRIVASREGFVVLGTLAAAGLPALLGADRAAALGGIGMLIWVLLPVSVVAAMTLVPEPRHIWRGDAEWRRGAAVLWGNRPFRRLLAAYFLNGIANGLPASLFLLFVSHVIERPDLAGPLLFAYLLCGVVAIPAWLRTSRRYGKHRVWALAMLAACGVFAFVPLLGAGDGWWFLLICILTGLCLGADLTLPASMQADVVDLDTLRTGRQRTGLYFALWGVATKLALALAVGIAFPLLEFSGFRGAPDGASETGLFALAALYSLLPVAFKVAAVALLRGYPITAQRQRRIRRLIRLRHASP